MSNSVDTFHWCNGYLRRSAGLCSAATDVFPRPECEWGTNQVASRVDIAGGAEWTLERECGGVECGGGRETAGEGEGEGGGRCVDGVSGSGGNLDEESKERWVFFGCLVLDFD